MTMTLHNKIKKISRKIGISVRVGKKARPIDLRDIKDINPVQLGYLSEGLSYFISVPVNKIIHMEYMSFGLDSNSRSPFLGTMLNYLNGDQSYEGSLLEKYYQLCRPSSVADFMGIDKPENNNLNDLDAPYAPRIFSSDSLEKTMDACEKRTLAENKKISRNKIGLDVGRSLYGPTFPEKGQIEFSRLTKILNSVRKNGYNLDLTGVDSISGVFLLDDTTNNWVVSVNSGQHRVACLAALGYSRIPIHIQIKSGFGVLRLSHTKDLPIVRNGIITRHEADSIFMRKIKKQPPACAYKWLNEADKLWPI